MKLIQTKDYLLLIDEEAEIKEWDYYYDLESKLIPIKQSIENSHKDFKSCKITAYYALTKEAKELDLPWLPNPFKSQSKQFSLDDMIAFGKKCFYKGFDKSENDDTNCFTAWREENSSLVQSLSTQQLPKEFVPQYDKINDFGEPYTYDDMDFGVEIEYKLKTITNSDGKEVLIGTYKY